MPAVLLILRRRMIGLTEVNYGAANKEQGASTATPMGCVTSFLITCSTPHMPAFGKVKRKNDGIPQGSLQGVQM